MCWIIFALCDCFFENYCLEKKNFVFLFENFVIDSSGSTSTIFPTTKQALSKNVLELPEQTLYGITNFGSLVQTELTYSDAQNHTDVADLILNLESMSGGTHIRTSLQRAWDDIWQPYFGKLFSQKKFFQEKKIRFCFEAPVFLQMMESWRFLTHVTSRISLFFSQPDVVFMFEMQIETNF